MIANVNLTFKDQLNYNHSGNSILYYELKI